MKTIIKCPNCRDKIPAFLIKNRWVKWIEIKCDYCGFKNIIKDFDLIQPSSPLFKMVYGNDPFMEYEINKKKREREDEKRTEELEDKYDREFKKTWERKFVKDKVLKEKF